MFDEDADAAAYEPVVRKMAGYLRLLELYSSFIVNPQTKAELAHIVRRIYEGLNSCGTATIPVNDSHTIRLCLVGAPTKMPLVKPHQVPLLVCGLSFGRKRAVVFDNHTPLTLGSLFSPPPPPLHVLCGSDGQTRLSSRSSPWT